MGTHLVKLFFALAILLLHPALIQAQEEDSTQLENAELISVEDSVQLKKSVWSLVPDSAQLKRHINILCSKGYFGRGYVGKGMQKASRYIAQQYKDAGLLSLGNNYFQPFSYSVNTFPSTINVRIGDRTLEAGDDYLIQAASNGADIEDAKIKVMDGLEFAKSLSGKSSKIVKKWAQWQKKMSKKKYVYLLQNTDTLRSLMQWKNNKELAAQLPEGIFLLPKRGKKIWTVSQEVNKATVVEVYDTSLLLDKKKKVSVTVINQFNPKFKAENVVAYVPGTEVKDSFIVITAHYDHLGKMGSRTMFPGASDNATGTAMMLELARYYAANPAKYSMVFIAFAGEEAGLVGSKYFTEHPLVPLEQIRFLLNLDIMGDATDGIAVVNGKTHEAEYKTLAALNATGENGFVFPDVTMGGPAANSDHYHFSEKGVPAFFIFTKGGKGYYHDIWDKAENVTLKNVPALGSLIKRFIATF
jgi:aminopeptidase YwaD